METALVLAALKGAASAAGSSGVKFLWEKAFKREARAADAVIAMAIIRAIEESRSQGVGADEAWWSRAGQQLIAPFVHKDVARYVLEAAISEPGNPAAVRETLVVALQNRDQDFSQLAIDLRFDEQKFLSSLPSIIADELRSAGAELNSPLLFLAQYAALLRIDRNVSSASAIGLDDSTRALAASTRVLLTQFRSRMAQLRVYIFDDFAAAGERLLSAEWDAYLRDADGPVLDLHWDLMGWTEVLEELTGERPRLTSVLDACRRLKARLEDAEVQLGTVFRDAGGIDVTGELELLTSYLDGLDAGDSDQTAGEESDSPSAPAGACGAGRLRRPLRRRQRPDVYTNTRHPGYGSRLAGQSARPARAPTEKKRASSVRSRGHHRRGIELDHGHVGQIRRGAGGSRVARATTYAL